MTAIRSGTSSSPSAEPIGPTKTDLSVTSTDAAETGEAAASAGADWLVFKKDLYEAPKTAVELLKYQAELAGMPELVAPLKGLRITDDGPSSVARNLLQNYPIRDIYETLNPSEG